jgi:hypothetical protein
MTLHATHGLEPRCPIRMPTQRAGPSMRRWSPFSPLPATAKWPKGAFGVQPFANAEASLTVFAPRGEDRQAADFDRAQMHGDAAELLRLLADDHVLYNSSDKVVGKAEFIRDYAGMKLQPFTVEDETIRVFGDAAVLAGVATLQGIDIASGEAFSS